MRFLFHCKIFKIFFIWLNIIAITIGDDKTKTPLDTITSILDNIKNGENTIEYPTDSRPNITLVLGNSGSGKSTFVQYVFGDNSKLESKPVLHPRKNQPTGDYYIVDNNQKIGTSSIYSYTLIPELIFDSNSNTSIYDCPGFKDNRSPIYDISATYFIKAITDRCKGIKFVFVINYSSVTMMENKQDFISLAKQATDMIKNVEKFKNSICLVANKVKDDKMDNDVILSITAYLEETRDQLKNGSAQGQNPQENKILNSIQQDNIIKFIDALLATDANGNYIKIGFIRQPKQAGPISGIDAMQKHKQLLIELLNTNIQFVTHNDSEDFGYTISSESLNYVSDLSDQLYQQITHHINGIVEVIKQHYDHLLQRIENIVQSFTKTKILTDVDNLEAQTFVDLLNTGTNVAANLGTDIKNIIPNQLSKKLSDSVAILKIQDNSIFKYIGNISTEANFLTFLQKFHNSTFSANQWAAAFENMETHLSKCTTYLRDNVTLIKNMQIENKLKEEMMKSEHLIKTYYRKQEATGNNDIKKLSHQFQDQHQKLFIKSQEIKTTEQEPFKCLSDIFDHSGLPYIGEYTTSISTILPNIKRYTGYLEYLHILNNNHRLAISYKCSNILDNNIKYLDDLKTWYYFLVQLYNRLSEYEIQNHLSKYKPQNFLQESIEHENKTIGDYSEFNTFLQNCCSDLYKSTYIYIKNMASDRFKLHKLKTVINAALMDDISQNIKCQSSTLTVKGHFIKLSNIIGITCPETITSMEIFALQKVFIDTSINKTGELFQLSIIAPTWEVQGYHKIILDGKVGDAATEIAEINQAGRPGLPGGNGGSFFGFGDNCINCENLLISANGGNGGRGQDVNRNEDNLKKKLNTLKASNYFSNVTKGSFGKNQCHFYYRNNEMLTKYGATYYSDSFLNKNVSVDYSDFIDAAYKEIWMFRQDDGGLGGIGGKPGKVYIQFSHNTNLHISNETGEQGEEGNSSILNIEVSLHERPYSNHKHWCPCQFLDNRLGCSVEVTHVDAKILIDNYGRNGKSYVGQGLRYSYYIRKSYGFTKPQDLIRPSHIVNTYMHFLQDNLNSNVQHSDLLNFLDVLNHDKFINELYDTAGFLDRLYSLEESYPILHTKIPMLPFYKWLLQNIKTYAQKPKPTETSAEYKKMLSFLYTATLSRIYSTNENNDNFMIEITTYLNSILEEIRTMKQYSQVLKQNRETLNDTLKEDIIFIRINDSMRLYDSKINAKIDQANGFINSDILPEIDNIINQTDQKMKLLINEIITAQNVTKGEEKQLQQQKEKLQDQLKLRYVLHSMKIAGTFLAFTGPVGMAVSATIGANSMVAEDLLLNDGQPNPDLTKLPAAMSNSITKITNLYSNTDHQVVKQLGAVEDLYLYHDHVHSNFYKGELRTPMYKIKEKFKNSQNNIPNINRQQQKQRANELKDLKQRISQWDSGKKRNTKSETISTCIDQAVIISELGIDVYEGFRDHYDQINQITELIKKSQNEITLLKQHQDEMYEIMILSCKQVQESVKSLNNELPGQSLAALDVTKWKIQSTIQDLQLQVQKMTQGFQVEEDVKRCITKLEYGMNIMIQSYNRIEKYREGKELTDYIYNIASPQAKSINLQNAELSIAIDKLNSITQSNLILREYEKALHAFLQYKFPFSYLYLDEFPSYLQLENSTNNLADQATKNINIMKTRLEKNEVISIDQFQSNYIKVDITFDGSYGNQLPFFVWKYDANKAAITELLQGHDVILHADITDANSIDENAVRFKEIGIRFVLANKTLQSELDEQLHKLSVEMIHLGNSYYRCDRKIYIISHDNQAVIHSVNKGKEGKYEMTNEVYKMIQSNKPVLSPYTLWKIKLIGKTAQPKYNFDELKQYLNHTIDLFLEGYGQYVKREETKSICENDLEKYYTLYKETSENEIF